LRIGVFRQQRGFSGHLAQACAERPPFATTLNYNRADWRSLTGRGTDAKVHWFAGSFVMSLLDKRIDHRVGALARSSLGPTS
jgi:hypothetical protein